MKKLSQIGKQISNNARLHAQRLSNPLQTQQKMQEFKDRFAHLNQSIHKQNLHEFKQQIIDLKESIKGQKQAMNSFKEGIKSTFTYVKAIYQGVKPRFLGWTSSNESSNASKDAKEDKSNQQLTKSQVLRNKLSKFTSTAKMVISTIKEAVVSIWEKIDHYIVEPIKNKDKRKEIIRELKERIKNFGLRKKEEEKSFTQTYKEKAEDFLQKMGIDTKEVTQSVKMTMKQLMLFSGTSFSKLIIVPAKNTSIMTPSQLDEYRRRFYLWRQLQIHKLYNTLQSEKTKQTIQAIKDFIRRQRGELKDGLVKYNDFLFWWKVDNTKYGARVRKWWRFRKAYKQGVLDFYMATILLVGGSVLLFGLFRGWRKRGQGDAYQEKLNQIRLEELALELERLQLELQMSQLDNEDINGSDQQIPSQR